MFPPREFHLFPRSALVSVRSQQHNTHGHDGDESNKPHLVDRAIVSHSYQYYDRVHSSNISPVRLLLRITKQSNKKPTNWLIWQRTFPILALLTDALCKRVIICYVVRVCRTEAGVAENDAIRIESVRGPYTGSFERSSLLHITVIGIEEYGNGGTS